MHNTTRTYRFVITLEVEPDHPAFDDRENGLQSTSTGITEVDGGLKVSDGCEHY